MRMSSGVHRDLSGWKPVAGEALERIRGASDGIGIGYFRAIATAVVPEECGGIGGATGALP
jgi:hypothetical protein